MTPADISIVIPTLNEESVVADSVASCLNAGATEVIIADGGSTDDTEKRATEAGATKIIHSLPGRGTQMNSGAVFASNQYVLFLHADNQLGAECLQQICDQKSVIWGAFRQHINAQHSGYRWIEWGNALRVQWRRIPFGDQAVFVKRSVYKQQGGFEEIPLMEDVQFAKVMRKVAKPVLLDGPVEISARRWQQKGAVRQTFRNFGIQFAHKCGVSPETLKQWYR